MKTMTKIIVSAVIVTWVGVVLLGRLTVMTSTSTVNTSALQSASPLPTPLPTMTSEISTLALQFVSEQQGVPLDPLEFVKKQPEYWQSDKVIG